MQKKTSTTLHGVSAYIQGEIPQGWAMNEWLNNSQS